MREALILGVVADIHHGAQTGSKCRHAALPPLRDFEQWASLSRPFAPKPEIVSPAMSARIARLDAAVR
jgi:hypothetical protein